MLSVAFGSGDALAKKKRKRKKRKKKAKTEEVYQAAYGMAGCGLGSILIKEDTMLMQIFAATLNATGYQTSGISSGTSNCTVGGSSDARLLEQEIYVQANLNSLIKEAAQGEGRFLRGFAEVLGCTNQFDTFATIGQEQYSTIFTSSDSKIVLENYRGIVLSNELLNNSCSRARI